MMAASSETRDQGWMGTTRLDYLRNGEFSAGGIPGGVGPLFGGYCSRPPYPIMDYDGYIPNPPGFMSRYFIPARPIATGSILSVGGGFLNPIYYGPENPNISFYQDRYRGNKGNEPYKQNTSTSNTASGLSNQSWNGHDERNNALSQSSVVNQNESSNGQKPFGLNLSRLGYKLNGGGLQAGGSSAPYPRMSKVDWSQRPLYPKKLVPAPEPSASVEKPVENENEENASPDSRRKARKARQRQAKKAKKKQENALKLEVAADALNESLADLNLEDCPSPKPPVTPSKKRRGVRWVHGDVSSIRAIETRRPPPRACKVIAPPPLKPILKRKSKYAEPSILEKFVPKIPDPNDVL